MAHDQVVAERSREHVADADRVRDEPVGVIAPQRAEIRPRRAVLAQLAREHKVEAARLARQVALAISHLEADGGELRLDLRILGINERGRQRVLRISQRARRARLSRLGRGAAHFFS